MELVTAAEMGALISAASEKRRIPSLRLMENAGRAVVLEMQRQFGPLRGKTVTVVSGKGQNGGDGFVIARMLRERGSRARVLLLTSPSALEGDAATTLRKYKRRGGRTYHVVDDPSAARVLEPLLRESDFLVDAIFGTGLNAPVQGPAAGVI